MRRRVDLIQLRRMIDDGKLQSEMAGFFKVSEGAISKNVKALSLAQGQDIILRSATKINDRKLNAMTRLERIAKVVEDELTYIRKTIKNTKGEERREWQEVQLKHTAEIRKQVNLLLEIAQALYNVEEVEAFKKVVLEEIGGVDEEIRKKILERIRQRRTYSGFAGPSVLGV
jgi:Na+/phosphate symporter